MLLEVIAVRPGDGAAAQEGGANRLEVVAAMEHDGLTPSASLVTTVRRECSLPLRVMLRARPGFGTEPAELRGLADAAARLADAGADGFVLGFLTPSGAVDMPAMTALLEAVRPLPWTFHRAIDAAEDPVRAWRDVRTLPRLDGVLSAGSPEGLGVGVDTLCARAKADSAFARLVVAGGGVLPTHAVTLASAGVRGFHVGRGARTGHTWDAGVDVAAVRRWRQRLDAATSP
jgi:copper homeostasis protein